MTNENKQLVEKKALRGRFDIVTRQLQGEYSIANGWAITANNLVANQLTVVVERVAPDHATGEEGGVVHTDVESGVVTNAPEVTTALEGTTPLEDKAKETEVVKTPVKRTTKATAKKTGD